jgi:hypothetical protein
MPPGVRVIDERELLEAVVEAAAKLRQQRVITTDREAETAWIKLWIAMDNLRDWQIHGQEVPGVPARLKVCEQCGATFFFGQLPTGRWLPIELDPVSSADVLPAWRYQVRFDGEHPTIYVDPAMESGQVWINHMETCGAKDGPKYHIAPYARRWRVNMARMDANQVDIINQLRALSDHLEEPAADGG